MTRRLSPILILRSSAATALICIAFLPALHFSGQVACERIDRDLDAAGRVPADGQAGDVSRRG